MSAVQEIKELKQKGEELEQQLKQKGIDKDERIAIHQRIIAIDNQITSLNPAAEKELSHQAGGEFLKQKPQKMFWFGNVIVATIIALTGAALLWNAPQCDVPRESENSNESQASAHHFVPRLCDHTAVSGTLAPVGFQIVFTSAYALVRRWSVYGKRSLAPVVLLVDMVTSSVLGGSMWVWSASPLLQAIGFGIVVGAGLPVISLMHEVCFGEDTFDCCCGRFLQVAPHLSTLLPYVTVSVVMCREQTTTCVITCLLIVALSVLSWSELRKERKDHKSPERLRQNGSTSETLLSDSETRRLEIL
jgi:hypothetical protein